MSANGALLRLPRSRGFQGADASSNPGSTAGR